MENYIGKCIYTICTLGYNKATSNYTSKVLLAQETNNNYRNYMKENMYKWEMLCLLSLSLTVLLAQKVIFKVVLEAALSLVEQFI